MWEWNHPHPIVELRLLKNRNFATAMFFNFLLGIVLFGTTVLIPQFLQRCWAIPRELAGEALAGGGFMMMMMMPIAGLLSNKVDPRGMIAFGFAATAARRSTTWPRI